MPEQCAVCYITLEPEPSFYWGAMFVSYAFSVACFLVGSVGTYYLLGNPDTWVYVLVITLLAAITSPIALRLLARHYAVLVWGCRLRPAL